MKKIISLISIFAIIFTFSLIGTTFAESLNTIKVDVDKTTVRPGENVTLTITFGEPLGAYTFDIAYDNNIFEYVSTPDGTANNMGNKVRVTFHDSTGGTSPKENMSIIFKAKEGITTSNPTELNVTGNGLANADASVTYDDITSPIVKNITVEPEYQDYVIKLEHTGEIIENKEKDMILSYSSSMGRYYEHARLIAEAKTPDDANVKLTATEAITRAEEDIIQSGWGDPQGYKIGGKDVSQVLNVKALFTKTGEYTITLKLIDRDNSDSVISEKDFKFTVAKETTPIVPPATDGNGQQPETQPEPETKPETKPQPQPETKPEVQENNNKPTKLPQTGNNIYVPMIVLIISLLVFAVYYNNKNKK